MSLKDVINSILRSSIVNKPLTYNLLALIFVDNDFINGCKSTH